MANTISLHLYRIEQLASGSFAIGGVFAKAMDVDKILDVTPVNSLQAIELPGLGMLYSKVTFQTPSLNQEAYVMQTVAQVHTLINA